MITQTQSPAVSAGQKGKLEGNMSLINSSKDSENRLTLQDLKNDIESNIQKIEMESREKLKPIRYQTILTELLKQIKKVDFRALAELDEKEKLTRKTYCVLVIDELIKIANTNNWGLATQNGFLYVYEGKMWQLTEESAIKNFLGEVALKMGVPKIEAQYHLFKDELFKQFISTANLPTPIKDDVTMVNLLNGVLIITDKGYDFVKHDRKYFFKYILPFNLDQNAKCPMFDRYINEVLPEKELQDILFEFIGCIFIPVAKLKLEKALILYGSGANGKSVFFEIMCSMLGHENICSYSLQNLTKAESYQRAELSNKLLNYASEINGKLETDTFKQLASGEPIEARQIYGKPFTMTDYAKLMFNCNELPREVEQTNAFFRRFILIPFNKTIPPERQDAELSRKIINSELSGVFNYVLSGLSRLNQQRKFTQSDIVKNLVDQYRKESDSVAMFVEDEGYKKSPSYTPLKSMYTDYSSFCLDNGNKRCSSKIFSNRLKTQGFNTERKNFGMVVFAEK